MWRPYSLSLSWILSFFFAVAVIAQEKTQYPGLIESLELLIKSDQNKQDNANQLTSQNPKLFSEVKEVQGKIKINPDFLASLILHTPSQYWELIQQKPCHFYSLLDTKLLRNSNGPVRNINALLEVSKNPVRWEPIQLTIQDFLSLALLKQCQELLTLREKFFPTALQQTLKSINPTFPKNKSECSSQWKSWIQDPRTPYLCHIAQKDLKREKRLSQAKQASSPLEKKLLLRSSASEDSNLNPVQYRYFVNFCKNLNNQENFCKSFGESSYWSLAIQEKEKKPALISRCQELLQSDKLTTDDFQECSRRLEEEPDHCYLSHLSSLPSLAPKQSCSHLGLALRHSRLKGSYADCPALIQNEGIVNLMRVYRHFIPSSNSTYPFSCATEATNLFANFNLQLDNNLAWDHQICFQNKALRQEECYPTLLNNHPQSPYSESRVLTKVIAKVLKKGADFNCTLKEKSEFKPFLLDFKRGCFILYDKNKCTATRCPKQVINDGQKFEDFVYKGNSLFEYQALSLKTQQRSLSFLIGKKIGRSEKRISHFSDLKLALENSEMSLIHGIGCAEDLLPAHFISSMLNQCSPLPFIIAGLIEQKQENLPIRNLVIYTALDDSLSPRLINWQYVFSAIKNYQNVQPLNSWSLYAF